MPSRIKKWKEKSLHGQYFKSIDGKIDKKANWIWLKYGTLKKETEGMIFAAQEQALRTNWIKSKIEKSMDNSKCRLCNQYEETMDHIISGCSKIAHTDYKYRHNKVAAMLHWNLCQNYGIPVARKWWEHKPEKVMESNDKKFKILWDFKIQTDKKLEHNTPDITVVEEKMIKLIDVAIPGDSRIEEKEIEKIEKYQDLRIEVQRLWEKKAVVIPVVVGALGAVPKKLGKYLEKVGIDRITTEQIQRTAILGTAYILRKYLTDS